LSPSLRGIKRKATLLKFLYIEIGQRISSEISPRFGMIIALFEI
jgi:hypothetical protein